MDRTGAFRYKGEENWRVAEFAKDTNDCDSAASRYYYSIVFFIASKLTSTSLSADTVNPNTRKPDRHYAVDQGLQKNRIGWGVTTAQLSAFSSIKSKRLKADYDPDKVDAVELSLVLADLVALKGKLS